MFLITGELEDDFLEDLLIRRPIMLFRVLDYRGVGRKLLGRPGDKKIKNTSEISITGQLEVDFLEDHRMRRPRIIQNFPLQAVG